MFLVDTHFSTTDSSYIKLAWTLVSHHPDDVIFVSPSTPPDLNPNDNFCQPPAEEILQLIKNIKHTHTQGSPD